MIPYAILTAAVVCLGVLEHSRIFPQNGRRFYLYIITLLCIFYSGFRALSVGADTLNYQTIFEGCKNIRWSAVIKELPGWTIPSANDCEFGFVMLTKFFQLFSDDYRIYLVTIAVVFFVSLAFFLKDKSCDLTLSYLVFICMFFSFYGTTGLRQTLATCAAVFLGYEFAKRQKPIPFALAILLACTIHKSALFFFPFYFLVKIKPALKNFALAYLAAIVIYLLRFGIINLIAPWLGYEDYAVQYSAAGTPVFTFFLIALSLVLMIRLNSLISRNSESAYWIHAILFALLLTPFTYIDPTIMRALQYYTLFLILIVPDLANGFEGREKMLAWLACAGSIVIMFFHQAQEYVFMWQ